MQIPRTHNYDRNDEQHDQEEGGGGGDSGLDKSTGERSGSSSSDDEEEAEEEELRHSMDKVRPGLDDYISLIEKQSHCAYSWLVHSHRLPSRRRLRQGKIKRRRSKSRRRQ